MTYSVDKQYSRGNWIPIAVPFDNLDDALDYLERRAEKSQGKFRIRDNEGEVIEL